MAISDQTDIAGTNVVQTQARIAVYDDMLASPRVIDIEPAPILEFIENITTTTYDHSRAQGGSLPYTVIREIVENFIHASFKECTVSILDSGNTLRFSDQGPGIEKKALVLEPGISSATAQMKKFIKGVGSGFPIVREYLGHSHGFMSIDDNAAAGTVITLVATPTAVPAPTPIVDTPAADPAPTPNFLKQIKLQQREEQTLLLLLDKGMLGPSELAAPLSVSKPTATRVLQKLESLDMVETAQNKKRILSNAGLAYAQQLASSVPAP